MPGLLVAYAPVGACTVDRCLVSTSFVVGRGWDCRLAISDTKVSKSHLRIARGAEGFVLEDLESTNGTFLNGRPVIGKRYLGSQSVIRAGSAVLVFVRDASLLLEPPPIERYEMAGVFHAGPLLNELGDAAASARQLQPLPMCALSSPRTLRENREDLPETSLPGSVWYEFPRSPGVSPIFH